MKNKIALFYLLCIPPLVMPVMAHAQYDLGDLTLYSKFTPESSLVTGETIDQLGQKTINNSNAHNMSDLSNAVPNLNFAGGSSNPKFYQIRGIGERSLYEGVPNSSVGQYVDSLDVGSLGTSYPLYDLKQVEVTKGPSATKYGANALAGSVSQITSASNNPSGYLNIDYSSYETSKLEAAFGSKRGALSYHFSTFGLKSEGMMENTYLDRNNTAKKDEWSGRLKLGYEKENYLADLLLTSYRQRNGYDDWSFDSGLKSMSDHPGRDDQNLDALALTQTVKLANQQSITATTNIGISSETLSYDEDWGNNQYWNALVGYNADYNYFAENYRKRLNLAQEIRYNTTSSNSGIYLQQFTEDSINKSFKDDAERLNKRIVGDFRKDVAAIFGKKSFELNSSLVLSLGARGEYSIMDYRDNNDQHFTPKNHYFGGEAILEYLGFKDQIFYGGLSRGFKHGGFNISSGIDESKRTYRPEYLYNLEFGHKIQNNKFSSKTAIFSSFLTDAQVNTTSQDNPSDPNDFTYYIGNAARSWHLGLENTFGYIYSKKWQTNLSLSYLRAKYLSYRYESQNLEGRDVAHAPNYQFNLATSYSPIETLTISTNIEGKDSFYFSNTHNQKSKAYALLNLKIEKSFGALSIECWAKNILDKRYAVRGYYFGNEPPTWDNKLYKQNGVPRTIGIGLKGQF